jgi:Tfp pilus assembly protein PilF
MNMLADHYFSSGNNVKALTLLKKIVTVQTQNHKAIWQIGRIYQTQEKNDAAQLLIEKALEQKPDHPKYLISLVEVHYEK